MTRHRRRAVLLTLTLSVTLAACGSGGQPHRQPVPPARWQRYRHVPGAVDLAGPRGDGSFTVAAAGRLLTLTTAGGLRPFARGRDGYATALGPEPYLAMTSAVRVAGTHCSFPGGAVFALQPGRDPGLIMIATDGRSRRFASLPAAANPDGIAFDATGRFGHALLVTARSHGHAVVLAARCDGTLHVLTSGAPVVEGGIAVAPPSFGRYGGDLIAPDESSGRIYAIAPDGTVGTLAAPRLPHGGDIGVESTGFVPPGFGPGDAAYLADRYSAHNRHPGTNSILRLPGGDLLRAGVRPGDLLVATEGSARTVAIRCARSCTVRTLAIGLPVSHAEGHIAFTRGSR